VVGHFVIATPNGGAILFIASSWFSWDGCRWQPRTPALISEKESTMTTPSRRLERLYVSQKRDTKGI
jgi:hypothetical protein